ncbi:MAG: hypothetical protein ACOC55_01865 [Candidatus Natronoplasma sp.]
MLSMKIIAILTLLFLVMFGRGLRAAVVIILVVVPIWLMAEKMNVGSAAPDFWTSTEEREEFSRLPLEKDMVDVRKARKGQKVKRALIEERIKEQVYWALRREKNLSEEEIETLKNDPEELKKRVDNERLRGYLKSAVDLNDLKTADKVEGTDLFSEERTKSFEDTSMDFDEKVDLAIKELEELYRIEEEGEKA